MVIRAGSRTPVSIPQFDIGRSHRSTCSNRWDRPSLPWRRVDLAFILGLSVSFGLAIIWFALFFTIYAIVCRRNHGMLLTKDRLATLADVDGSVSLPWYPWWR